MDRWDVGQGVYVSLQYMRTLRRLEWEERVDWDGNLDRKLDSSEVLNEDLQDFTIPMVAIGSDVISMYPNLEVDSVVDMKGEEIQRTHVK